MKPISRTTIDLVARAVISGRRGFGNKVDWMADAVAGVISNRLEAAGAPGGETTRGRRRSVAAVADPQMFAAVLRRVEKHLGSHLLTSSLNEKPHARRS